MNHSITKTLRPKVGWKFEVTISGPDKETADYIAKMMEFHLEGMKERLPVNDLPISRRPCSCKGGGG